MTESADNVILIVEDSPQDLELTVRALRQSKVGNRLQVARDGAEALEYLFGGGAFPDRKVEDAPTLILLDLKLPKVDGLEVLIRIKADSRTRSIPVVMLTSSKEQRDIIESYRLGVNSYIVKPVNFERFTATVQELGLYWTLLNRAPGDAT